MTELKIKCSNVSICEACEGEECEKCHRGLTCTTCGFPAEGYECEEDKIIAPPPKPPDMRLRENKTNLLIKQTQKIIKPEDINEDTLRYLGQDSLALWAQASGVKVDNNAVDFNTHRYLLPIYADNSKEVVWQKAAQMGATVYMMLRLLWWLEKNQGRKASLYMPTKELVDNTSKDRLTPLIQSSPSIREISDINDKLSLRKIGQSSLYMFHLDGKASKDSVPLDFVAFDEVRLCDPTAIDQALQRISHSPFKYKVFMSTAGMPEADIAARFDLGTQHIWLSKCGCPDGCDLARTFPDCVVDDKKRGLLYLRCPKCKYTIKDPQNGRYVPHNPGARYNSYSVSQLVSKYRSLDDIWDFYKRTVNMEEFHNATLGLPFIDSANRGVTLDQLKSCIDPYAEWAQPLTKRAPRTAMGIDQGGGYNMIVIADLYEGRKRLRHIEIVEQENPIYRPAGGGVVSPFKRAQELMKEYNVQLCVCDAMPNYNEALSFAQANPGKVFLAWYQTGAKDVIQWGDRMKAKEGLRKAGNKLKFKYQVVLSRYLSLGVSLGAFRDGDVLVPDPNKLVQMCRDEKTGQFQPEALADRLFNHLCRLVKRYRVTNEETGDGKHEWVFTGGDPHLAHAWNYCNAALERLTRQTIWTFG